MAERKGIKLTHVGLEDFVHDGITDIILRGVIEDPRDLEKLLVDTYQRELIPTQIGQMRRAMRENKLPDVDLAMRGAGLDGLIDAGGIVYLQAPTYIVDGQQRREAALQLYLQEQRVIKLGAMVHLNTTRDWERRRFQDLNLNQRPVGVNVILRDQAEEYPVVDALYQYTLHPDSVLYDKVCWKNSKSGRDLITAQVMFRVTGLLHEHLGGPRGHKPLALCEGLSKLSCHIGTEGVVDNTRAFFGLIDECWGVREIFYVKGAYHMKTSFLMALAQVLGKHLDFWTRDNRLEVNKKWKTRLKSFPLSDPEILRLIGSTGQSQITLAERLVNHLNYKLTEANRLHPREPKVNFLVEDDDSKETE